MANIFAVNLENFQSHLDTYIEFKDGLNVIVGQSDSGKTAILRGIRWALYNQPRGTDFMRVGADFVRVTVIFDNGVTIIRERTSSKNRYIIRDEQHEELILEGFGVHVPKEVLEVHQMNNIQIDQDTELAIHLSQQLDGPFLLEQTSAARAKTLGRISGAHFLDMAIRDTSKDLSQLNQRMKTEKEQIENLKEELTPYENLNDMKKQLEETELNIDQLNKLMKRKEKLLSLKEQKIRLYKEKEIALQQKELVQNVDDWAQRCDRLEEQRKLYTIYKKRNEAYNEIQKTMATCQVWLEKTTHVQRAVEELELLKTNREKFVKLYSLRKIVDRMENDKTAEQSAMKKTSFLEKVRLEVLDEVMDKRKKWQKLKLLKDQLDNQKKQKKITDQMVNRLPNNEVILLHEENLEKKYTRLQRLQRLHAEQKEMALRIKNGKVFIKEKVEEQIRAEREWEQHLLAAGTCPTCGQSLCSHKGGKQSDS